MSHQDNSNGEQFSRKGVKYFVAALKEFIHDADIYVWKICSIEKLTCQKNADIATNIFLWTSLRTWHGVPATKIYELCINKNKVQMSYGFLF